MKDLLGYTLLVRLAWPLSLAAQTASIPPTVSTLARPKAKASKAPMAQVLSLALTGLWVWPSPRMAPFT